MSNRQQILRTAFIAGVAFAFAGVVCLVSRFGSSSSEVEDKEEDKKHKKIDDMEEKPPQKNNDSNVSSSGGEEKEKDKQCKEKGDLEEETLKKNNDSLIETPLPAVQPAAAVPRREPRKKKTVPRGRGSATLFVSGIPESAVIAGFKRALVQCFRAFVPENSPQPKVKVGRNERGHTSGYAWVTMPTPESASAATKAASEADLTLDFHVPVAPISAGAPRPPPRRVVCGPLSVGPICTRDKRDLLFPDIPHSARGELQFDGVALFSVIDALTARRIVDIVETFLSASSSSPSSSSSSSSSSPGAGLYSVTDAFACVGGSAVAFARSPLFREVVAVELDPSRAAMLGHNVRIALAAPCLRMATTSATDAQGKTVTRTANTVSAPANEGFAALRRVRVVESNAIDVLLGRGDAVDDDEKEEEEGGGGGGNGTKKRELGAGLAHQVVFMDPPWGGTHYNDKEQLDDLYFESTDAAMRVGPAPGDATPSSGSSSSSPLSPLGEGPSGRMRRTTTIGMNELVLRLGRSWPSSPISGKRRTHASRVVVCRLPVNYNVDKLAAALVAPGAVPADPVWLSSMEDVRKNNKNKSSKSSSSKCGGEGEEKEKQEQQNKKQGQKVPPPSEMHERPLPFLLKLGPKALLFVVCFTPQPVGGGCSSSGIPSGVTTERVEEDETAAVNAPVPLQFSLRSLDAIMDALALAERSRWRREHSPKFWDYDAGRWIRAKDWKGTFSRRN